MIKTQWVVVIQNDGAIWGGFPLLGIPPARNPEVILALPVLAYPVNSIRRCALLPKGLRISAQGCDEVATWVSNARQPNPNGVASFPDVLLVPFQTVFSKKGSVFVLEAPFFVMFFLIGDVFSDRVQIGFADRKRTVSALPSKSR
uniref:Uncharacterized protein n=3 Tax=Candidatus Kentrum sp. TUN TaxID=2126343 RepID=A0A451AVJ4_9GAMM|nr:MAG: hypothetical protein BECKTUN1418E_GA0071001_12323 [Candidatus Kentron sp. TUN]